MGADMPVEAPLWQFPMLTAHVSRDARFRGERWQRAGGCSLPA